MSTRARAIFGFLVVSLCAPALARSAAAQYFGRNKVEYRKYDFQTLRTEHFDIYYYAREEPAARDAARMAERWYARLSVLLKHTFESRQPIILYGSHPEFSQTNVVQGFLDESTGGVTESLRRRIVLPFAPGLAETDHVLGHEIVHAFQIDMVRKLKHPLQMPLWFAEGMAEYLSVGSVDPLTAAWVRDAAAHGDLPALEHLGSRGVSPYRIGHAFWAYMAGRFGDDFIRQVLQTDASGSALHRIAQVAGVDAAGLSRQWLAAVTDDFAPVTAQFVTGSDQGRSLIGENTRSRLNIAPALSPDGRQVVFLSERDQLSIDVFLASAESGAVIRKLLTTTADQHLESLQFVNSSGAWDPSGRQFIMSAVRGGAPVLLLFDVATGRRTREIPLPALGEIFTPSWSPRGDSVVFSALEGGLTDLYILDLNDSHVRRLTEDAFTDLQPAWSPDGTRVAFVTDRFSTDLPALRFGRYELAVMDLGSGTVERVGAFETTAGTKSIDPHWSRDGAGLFFVASPFGISNVFRIDLPSRSIAQVSDVAGGVMGLTSASPALSVARAADTLAFSVFQDGRFLIKVIDSGSGLAGHPVTEPPFRNAGLLPPHDRASRAALAVAPPDAVSAAVDQQADAYVPRLSLEGFGQPYVASGGSQYGTFIQGGTSFLFGDMLGGRKLGAALQIGTKREDFATQIRYLNREKRWNWGTTLQVLPYVRGGARVRDVLSGDEPAISRETERLTQTHSEMGAFVAYPFSRLARIELSGGVHHIVSERQTRSRIFGASSRKLIRATEDNTSAGANVMMGEAGVALVHDSAIWGPAAPILGTRSRVEVAPAFGDLSFSRLLVDYRRYLMPVRPFTLAARLQYQARYGPGADDARLQPLFVGYRNLVRGYDLGSLSAGCTSTVQNECASIDRLTGSRTFVANIEMRFPVMGALSRSQTYGAVPLEGVLFADGGRVRGQLARSAGAAVRVAPFGFVAELGVVRAFDHPSRHWSFLLNFQPGF